MTTLIALGITLLVFLIIVFLGLLRAKGQPRSISQQAQPTPPPAPAPTPAPAASYGWVWWIIIIGAIAGVIYWANSKDFPRQVFAPAPTPQATAPKRELKKHELKIPLEFVGGEKLNRGSGWISIQEGGYANLRVNLPVLKNGKYKIYYHGKREKEGRDYLEINRGKGNGGNPFSIEHRSTDFPIELVFFDDGYAVGMPGEAKYFRGGENYFKLWADNNLLIQLDQPRYLEITYWE